MGNIELKDDYISFEYLICEVISTEDNLEAKMPYVVLEDFITHNALGAEREENNV